MTSCTLGNRVGSTIERTDVRQAQVAAGVRDAELPLAARGRPSSAASRSIVVSRLPKPVRNARWTKNHTTQPGKPLRLHLADAGDGPEPADGRDAARGRGT